MANRDSTHADQSFQGLIVRISIQVTIFLALWGCLLFWSAGSILWVRAWIHLGLWTLSLFVNLAILWIVNPGIIITRLEMKRPTERFDKILAVPAIPVALAIPVVAGLDAVRYKLTSLPMGWMYIGIALHIVGDAFMVWCAAVNPYLEKIVRIQEDRDHQVVTTGPYAIVRHPMYLGVLLLIAGMPLVLGSLWAFAPVGCLSLLLVIRTVWEDRLLRQRLPGYEEYAHQTRFRLIPGIW